jgi:porin
MYDRRWTIHYHIALMDLRFRSTAGLIAAAFSVAMFSADVSQADPTSGNQPVTASSLSTTTPSQPPDFSNTLTGDWLGARTKLADAGATVGATLILEGFDNFQGGLDTAHAVGATTFDLNLTLDLEKMLGIHGAQFYFDLEDHAFRNPSTSLVGDLQVFDATTAPPYLQVFAIWYQQTFLDDKLRLKIGKVDANTEFSVIDNGLTFLNSSAEISPTVPVMPTTPDPMPSINLFFSPADWWFAGVGAYYANQSDRFGDIVGDSASAQRSRYGAFLIGETGLRWNNAPFFHLAGNLKVGGWGHTGTFERFDGSEQAGTGGGYAIFDQTLYQPPGESQNGRGLRMFLEYGGTQSDIFPIDEHAGAGCTYTGPIASRAQDVLGITAQYAQISHAANLIYPYELEIEGFYQFALTPWMQVQPDMQYIIHPGGRYSDALVATLRCTIQF